MCHIVCRRPTRWLGWRRQSEERYENAGMKGFSNRLHIRLLTLSRFCSAKAPVHLMPEFLSQYISLLSFFFSVASKSAATENPKFLGYGCKYPGCLRQGKWYRECLSSFKSEFFRRHSFVWTRFVKQ